MPLRQLLQAAMGRPACDQYANQDGDHNLSSAILGGINGGLDSKHLKVGQPIQVKSSSRLDSTQLRP